MGVDIFEKVDILELRVINGANCVNGQMLSEYRVSLAERKEKSRFLTVSGSV